MAPQIPSCEPSGFVAGDTVQWTKSLSDYPSSDGWTLKYRFVGDPQINTGTAYTASVVNGEYSVTIPAADTAGAVSDTLYRLLGWVEGVNSERHSVFDGLVTAFANVATATIEDLQTRAERELALLDEALANRQAGEGIISYTIDGRSVQFDTMKDAYTLRTALAVRVHRERGGGIFITHQVKHNAVR